VEYQQSVALDEALREAGVSSSFQTIEGGGHGDFANAVPELDRRIEAFLEKMFYDQAAEVQSGRLEFKRPDA
jgi:acetyl esterase/lipase